MAQPWPAAVPGPPGPADRGSQPEVMLTGRWQAPFRVDLARTVGVHRRGTGDPAFRVEPSGAPPRSRSEEHTSELQSQSNLVCRLLLEKNKNMRYDALLTTRIARA